MGATKTSATYDAMNKFHINQMIDCIVMVLWNVQYLTVYKHKLLELEEQHKQVKETHDQTEQQLLMEKTSHEETRLQLRNARSGQERTQQELKGKLIFGEHSEPHVFSNIFFMCTHDHHNPILHYLKYIVTHLSKYVETSWDVWADQIRIFQP